MSNPRIFPRLFYFFALEGVVALAWLLSIPSESGSISAARFGLAFILLSLCLFWAYLGYRPPGNLIQFARPPFIGGAAVLSLLFSLTLLLLRYLNPEQLLPIYERLSPLLWYFLVLTVQIAFALAYLRGGFNRSALSRFTPVYFSALFILFILTSALVLVVRTRLGITFDPAYWAEPGVPIPGWQFATALIFGGIAFIVAGTRKGVHQDMAFALLIYGIAVALWLSVPVEVLKTSYYMPLTAPNFQPYPYSDSIYYDQQAQSVLIGQPYQGMIPTRPLYITFLTLLHLLFGQVYAGIIVVQTLVLALIPVLLYLLGRKLHGTSAGLIVALFFISREWTSLLISSETRVTNTKMLLVDLPTLLLLLISCLVAFAWLENRRSVHAFISGGVFGVLLLLRTQSLFIILLLFLFAACIQGWRNRMVYRQILLFSLGLVVSIVPWLTHNYLQTGRLAFDSAGQLRLLVSQYTGSLSTMDEMGGEGSAISVLLKRMVSDPDSVIGFVANHFMAIQVNGMLAFPINEEYLGLFAPMNLYWMRWERGDVNLDAVSMSMIYLYLVVISIGIGSVWRRWRWLGLLPLAYSAGYAVATALSRYSGWRYDFPSDWVWYFYFGIGFSEILVQVSALFGTSAHAPALSQPKTSYGPALMRSYFVSTILFLFIGSLPWTIKFAFPPRYADQSHSTLLTRLSSVANLPSREELKAFIETPDTFLETGRLLYPRYFPRNRGLTSANPSPAYTIREFSRLGFYLLNQRSTAMILPMDTAPGPIPHASDVIVLGCERDGYAEARLLVFLDEQLILSGMPLSEPCSP